MYTEENTRIMSTGKMGNLKQTGGLYQCQYAGCALYYHFSRYANYWGKLSQG